MGDVPQQRTTSTSSDAVVEIRSIDSPVSFDLGQFWRNRELTLFLAERDLRVRYKQTLLGSPGRSSSRSLRGRHLHASSSAASPSPERGALPVFAMPASRLALLLLGRHAAADEPRRQRRARHKVYFPRHPAPPAAVVLPGFVDLLIALLVLVVVHGRLRRGARAPLVLFPPRSRWAWCCSPRRRALAVGPQRPLPRRSATRLRSCSRSGSSRARSSFPTLADRRRMAIRSTPSTRWSGSSTASAGRLAAAPPAGAAPGDLARHGGRPALAGLAVLSARERRFADVI